MEENEYGLRWIKTGHLSNKGLLKIGRNLEISKTDGRNWNLKEPKNLKNRRKEMELEGTYKMNTLHIPILFPSIYF